MAGFQGHITTSTTLGVGLGFVGHWSGLVPDTTCLLAAGMCSFAGMMPDLDSVKSRQHREIIGFFGAIVAAFAIQRLAPGMGLETATAAACLIYLVIRFGVSWLIRVSTYHRGMFHSIPAAILAGELTFLLVSGTDSGSGAGNMAASAAANGATEVDAAIFWLHDHAGGQLPTLFKSAAVVIGYLSHLVLDEMCSVASNGKIQIKQSLGTAFKFFGKSSVVNFAMVILILGLMDPIMGRWSEDAATSSGAQLAVSQPTSQNADVNGLDGGGWSVFVVSATPNSGATAAGVGESPPVHTSSLIQSSPWSSSANTPNAASADTIGQAMTPESGLVPVAPTRLATVTVPAALVPPTPPSPGAGATADFYTSVPGGVPAVGGSGVANPGTVPGSSVISALRGFFGGGTTTSSSVPTGTPSSSVTTPSGWW